MRQFLVLGYKTTKNSEQGVQVHMGMDRGEAIDFVNQSDAKYARKALFELAVPQITRHFEKPAEGKKPAKKRAVTE